MADLDIQVVELQHKYVARVVHAHDFIAVRDRADHLDLVIEGDHELNALVNPIYGEQLMRLEEEHEHVAHLQLGAPNVQRQLILDRVVHVIVDAEGQVRACERHKLVVDLFDRVNLVIQIAVLQLLLSQLPTCHVQVEVRLALRFPGQLQGLVERDLRDFENDARVKHEHLDYLVSLIFAEAYQPVLILLVLHKQQLIDQLCREKKFDRPLLELRVHHLHGFDSLWLLSGGGADDAVRALEPPIPLQDVLLADRVHSEVGLRLELLVGPI